MSFHIRTAAVSPRRSHRQSAVWLFRDNKETRALPRLKPLRILTQRVAGLGLQWRLALTLYLAVLFAATVICATLYLYGRERLYSDAIQKAEAMVQAAGLAFSQALADSDEVLLDALLHELQSRKELAITEAYVIDTNGRVVVHSRTEERGKRFPAPPLLKEYQPASLSQVERRADAFRVLSLLQVKGATRGGLIVTFTTAPLAERLKSEMYEIVAATVPVLLLSGLAVSRYARGTVKRLMRLKEKALAVGRGDWDAPVAVEGSDEIAQLGAAFNRMQSDLAALRAQERTSAETIFALYRDLKEQLGTIERLKEQLAEENAALRAQLHAHDIPGGIIGADGGLRPVMEQARQIAPLAINVLISGESGTGKELLANYLHEASARNSGPLVKVNCAALPLTLIESELFGHEKGSFTGALAQKKGKFELAHGGTLFLDEVGELPLEAQAKLLRALQQGEIARVGSDRPISVDVRVIAATNRALAEEVGRGKFREDLYYRLKVVELVCPPLRARGEDLPVLAQHFVERYAAKLNKPVVGISRSALERLLGYRWPGNIRELEHQIARAVALATSQVLGPDDFALPPDVPASVPATARAPTPFEQLLGVAGLDAADARAAKWDVLFDACERVCLQAALRAAKNQKEAAANLGLTETKLHRLLKKHGLSR